MPGETIARQFLPAGAAPLHPFPSGAAPRRRYASGAQPQFVMRGLDPRIHLKS
jgi:hypothetical protein